MIKIKEKEYPTIIDLYLNKNKTLKEIANIYNLKSLVTIRHILKKNKVNLRSRKEGIRLSFINGRKSWNKGLKIKDNLQLYSKMYSEERNKKMGERFKGVTLIERYGEEQAKKFINVFKKRKGIKLSEETKKKLSLMRRGIIPKNIDSIKGWNKGNKSGSYIKCKVCNSIKYVTPSEFKSNKTKKFFCNPECQYKYYKLNNHHNWLGGKSFEPYGLSFSDAFREVIKIRDNDSCMICGGDDRLGVHHIDYNKLNTIKENCILLCNSCHMKTNFNRPSWTKFFQSLLSEKYRYTYSENLEPIIILNKTEVKNE